VRSIRWNSNSDLIRLFSSCEVSEADIFWAQDRSSSHPWRFLASSPVRGRLYIQPITIELFICSPMPVWCTKPHSAPIRA
jgi:hypothetical protein